MMNYVARPRVYEQIRVEDIVRGSRRALAKAITLAESTKPSDSSRLSHFLHEVHQTVKVRTVPRFALSGSPGAGKSTLLETLGYYLCEKKGMRVGVLAVDPSSTITHGSILGDKTRMEKLSTHSNAYIRPSPSGGHLGGVTARAWEVMEIFEAANFDVVFVETVGVGQSETQCKDLTDMMLLLVPPASGDELQGIKKGIVEVADMVVVTKNDGDRKLLAQQTKGAYARAVMYTEVEQGFEKPVIAVSAEKNTQIVEMWETLMKMWESRVKSGQIDHLRRSQSTKHFYNYFEMELLSRAKKMVNAEMLSMAHRVWEHEMTPREAGDIMVQRTLREHLLTEKASPPPPPAQPK
ncbi:kinase-like protein [Leptomonas seymouri]|uniref:Kinase-like protein n=1 Tax=Leptomonas seymouri TaxID=5684 RepID=A0A0N0P3P9_LEPSE|nr:kinase-like protein [Leptomonas seymouri]|eukprot:KPI83917.1 kinase-like protein [Leptomonas seymouri]